MIHRLQIKKMAHDRHAQDIWLTIYADMITNLTLLFLALYGLTLMGDKALQEALASFRAGASYEHSKSASSDPHLALSNLAQVLKSKLNESSQVSIQEGVDRVQISLGSGILFGPGRAELKPEALGILHQIADVVGSRPGFFLVDGHTDDRLLRPGGPYKTNWELSMARAMAVVRQLTVHEHLDPKRFAIGAYGSEKPRFPNDTEEHRLKNRRVEIAVFKES